ncbi:unnamed protein product, partial [Ectocarpus sp. 12 AP-2014]
PDVEAGAEAAPPPGGAVGMDEDETPEDEGAEETSAEEGGQETPQEEGGEVRLPREDDGSESRCPLAERWSQRRDPGRSISTGCSRVRLF